MEILDVIYTALGVIKIVVQTSFRGKQGDVRPLVVEGDKEWARMCAAARQVERSPELADYILGHGLSPIDFSPLKLASVSQTRRRGIVAGGVTIQQFNWVSKK